MHTTSVTQTSFQQQTTPPSALLSPDDFWLKQKSMEGDAVKTVRRMLEERTHQKEIRQMILKDSVLPTDIQLKTPYQSQPTERILLIGATGNLGPHLLHALLTQSNADIYCVMRDQSAAAARERLRESAKNADRVESLDFSRIHIVLGELGETHLRISEDEYELLSRKIDTVILSASYAHHVAPYIDFARQRETIRKTNAFGVTDVLRFVVHERPKKLCFVSSTIAWHSNGRVPEQHPPVGYDGTGATMGYAHGKLVAEKLLGQAAERGIPTFIYRFGQITGDSQTGKQFADRDHLMMQLKGCVQLGYAPLWASGRSYFPVDLAGKYIGEFALHQSAPVVNMIDSSSVSWGEIVEALQRRGYPVQLIPEHEWASRLVAMGQSNVLYPFGELYTNPVGHEQMLKITNESFYVNLFIPQSVENAAFTNVLEKSGEVFPETKKLLTTYLDYFEESGFLKAT